MGPSAVSPPAPPVAWTPLGRNAIGEWVDENSSGQRRVRTAAGPLLEPAAPDVRFARLGAADDVHVLVRALRDPLVRASYGSLDRAAAVWSAPRAAPTPAAAAPHVRAALSALLDQTDRVPGGPPPTRPAFAPPDAAPLSIAPLAPVVIDEDTDDVYRPFTALDPSGGTGYAAPLLNQAMRQARPSEPASVLRARLAQRLGWDSACIEAHLSDDQLDAIWMADHQVGRHRAFLLGDETGYGKGRTLAALAALALHAGQQVLFVTEKKNLLSDFYRDVLAVFPDAPPVPVVCHSTARVTAPDRSVVVPPKDNRWPESGDRWVWTTYSQFNRKNKPKMDAVEAWMRQPTLLILDEAQNAAGTSATAKNIRTMEACAIGVVYSSATPIKQEEQLDAYRRLFDGSRADWTRLKSAFASDTAALRTAVSLAWAEQGVYMRREHPPMELPQPLWVPRTDAVRAAEDILARWWMAWRNAVLVWGQASNKPENPWTRLGAPLSRAVREMGLLLKTDALVEAIRATHTRGGKSVVVADWTLSAHAARVLESVRPQAPAAPQAPKKDAAGESDTDDTDNTAAAPPSASGPVELPTRPLWRDAWALAVRDMLPDAALRLMPPAAAQSCVSARQQVLDALAELPDWTISPFDDLTARLTAAGLRVAEISGRAWSLEEPSAPGASWQLRPRPVVNRTAHVADYNAGHYDVMLLTRAGNSGISLHAGASFADQRPRHLLEWDVAPDPSVRLQFWGRVRRKDQVCEPERSTLLIDTPAERRRLARDSAKQARLVAHAGGNAASGGDSRVAASWVGADGAFVAREWVRAHPTAEAVLDPWPDASVEKILARAVVLPEADRLSLLNHVSRGVDLLADPDAPHHHIESHPSRAVRSCWWWGQGANTLTWQEQVWPAQPTASAEAVRAALADGAHGRPLSDVVARWSRLWEDWWREQPQERTPRRAALLAWWVHNAAQWERGTGVVLTDPAIGAPTRALVLGAQGPDSDNPRDWSASQIALTAWPATRTRPLTWSLSAWMDPHRAAARPAGVPPSPLWFSGDPLPRHARVLVGPSWSVVAWGVRHAPIGRLVHLNDADRGACWAWCMPSGWSWNDLRATDRELASVGHALAFFRVHPTAPVRWRWSPSDVIHSTPQEGGLFLTAPRAALDRIAFPMQMRLRSLRWNPNRTVWSALLPWQAVPEAVHQWSATGALPTVDAAFAPWHAATFREHANAR